MLPNFHCIGLAPKLLTWLKFLVLLPYKSDAFFIWQKIGIIYITSYSRQQNKVDIQYVRHLDQCCIKKGFKAKALYCILAATVLGTKPASLVLFAINLLYNSGFISRFYITSSAFFFVVVVVV